jgi:hypothetical protein
MSSLAERLKEKGYDLPAERPAVPRHANLTTASHKELSLSAREKNTLFTPVVTNTQKVVQAEEKFKRECGKDLLKGVKKTVTTWVQECIADPEKIEKLKEKGMVKCRVQAQWSKDLNDDLHAFVENFGGRVAAACEKENAAAQRPAWEKYAARDEKWIIAFDATAFERFISSHPQVLGPSDLRLREFIEEHSRRVDIETSTIRELLNALEFKFGPLTQATKSRAQRIVSEVVNGLEEARQHGQSKRAGANAAKRPRLAAAGHAGLSSPDDAAWAAALLAPLGLRPGSKELMIKAPLVVLAPTLASLKSLQASAELLRSTNLGIIVASYRHHSNLDIARVAKELVLSWKAACLPKHGSLE